MIVRMGNYTVDMRIDSILLDWVGENASIDFAVVHDEEAAITMSAIMPMTTIMQELLGDIEAHVARYMAENSP